MANPVARRPGEAAPAVGPSGLNISKELLEKSKIHSNVSQNVIITTEDKIELCLRDYQEELRRQRDWIAPTGILLTILAALVTTEFKDFLSIPGQSWQILFLAGLVSTSVWLVITAVRAFQCRGRGTIKSIIEKLKP